MAIALVSDGLSFFLSPTVIAEPLVIGIDLVTGVLIWLALGRPMLLFAVFLAEAIPGLEDGFAKGDFVPLREWLNREVHSHGRRFLPEELCKRVTGSPLSSEHYLNYLEGKLRPLYNC